MSFGPRGANASSAAQPGSCRLAVRWQVEQASGRWWDIPQSAVIDSFYTESAAGVTYNYAWGDGKISRYELHFARREVVNLDTRRVRRVQRAFVETSVQALS